MSARRYQPNPRRDGEGPPTLAPVTAALPTTSYCTIIARNYLAKALAMKDSLVRHGHATELHIMVIDARDVAELPEVPGVVWMLPDHLALTTRQALDLAMIYDLTEFATAIKPLLLLLLLEDTDQAIYLDPDTYVVTPMEELVPALRDSEAGILLTPHVVEPNPSHETLFSEGHLLYVGMYNLGFCAVDRRATEFLNWWWGHLATECLHSPMDGLFVDQKWIDIGSVLFHATAFRHYGYNVGVGNLHERVIESGPTGRTSPKTATCCGCFTSTRSTRTIPTNSAPNSSIAPTARRSWKARRSGISATTTRRPCWRTSKSSRRW